MLAVSARLIVANPCLQVFTEPRPSGSRFQTIFSAACLRAKPFPKPIYLSPLIITVRAVASGVVSVVDPHITFEPHMTFEPHITLVPVTGFTVELLTWPQIELPPVQSELVQTELAAGTIVKILRDAL